MCYNNDFDPTDEQFEDEKEDLLLKLREDEKSELLKNTNLPKEDIDFLVDHYTAIDPNMETVLQIESFRKSFRTHRLKVDDLINDDFNLADVTTDNFITLSNMDEKQAKAFKRSYEKTKEYKNYKKKK